MLQRRVCFLDGDGHLRNPYLMLIGNTMDNASFQLTTMQTLLTLFENTRYNFLSLVALGHHVEKYIANYIGPLPMLNLPDPSHVLRLGLKNIRNAKRMLVFGLRVKCTITHLITTCESWLPWGNNWKVLAILPSQICSMCRNAIALILPRKYFLLKPFNYFTNTSMIRGKHVCISRLITICI